MAKLNLVEIQKYVEGNISTFHEKRLTALRKLKLKKVLAKKNPYLFKAKFNPAAFNIVKSLTDAYLSSQEETIFGDWLEGLALFINHRVHKGRKSGIAGIDIEFDKDGIRYIVTVKSGPNWGNSSQIKKLKADFKTAKITLRTSDSKLNVVAINGCCYGRDNKPDKGEYFKYCGQQFWQFISDDPNLYIKIIEPLGHKAKERNKDFEDSYWNLLNIFSAEFTNLFCLADGSIDWDKLVRFNSAIVKPKI
jgi:hypothetical protein